MRGLTFERCPIPRPHSLLKTQPRWRHVQSLGGTRCLGNITRRRACRLTAVPDRFSHAWSKPALNQGTANLDVMPVDVPKLPPANKDRMQRDHLWNDWLEYLSQIESVENERTWLHEELQEHIAIEDYKEAARTKRELEVLNQQDVLPIVQEELTRAIKEERYDDAARLRDEGLVGLSGWWVVRGHDDPRGQLMHISKEFCRYSGRLFTPNEIVSLCGVSESFMMEEYFAEKTEMPTGHFVMEVFLRRDPNGSFQHQGCVLRTPGLHSSGDSDVEEEIAAEVYVNSAEDTPHEALRVRVSIIQVDDDEDEREDISQPPLVSPTDDAEVASVMLNEASYTDESAELYDDKTDEDDFAPTELQYRLPADLQWWDRNRFVLSVDEETADAEEDDDDEDTEDGHASSEDATSASKLDVDSFDLEKHLTKALEKAIDDMPFSELKPLLKERISLYSVSKKLHALIKHTIKKLEVLEVEGEGLPVVSKKIWVGAEKTELEGEVMFTRLPLEKRFTDPFTGIFVGRFGPHGLEILHLSRQIDATNGKECVYVRKITGDPNVPAGELSFMASIDRENRTVPDAMHSEELGIRVQYSGRGRIAQTGYKKPEWVDGDLLVFDPTSPLAGGAELGLVWSVPHARRAHILLYRLIFPQME